MKKLFKTGLRAVSLLLLGGLIVAPTIGREKTNENLPISNISAKHAENEPRQADNDDGTAITTPVLIIVLPICTTAIAACGIILAHKCISKAKLDKKNEEGK